MLQRFLLTTVICLFAAGTAYASFDRHMFDDLRPHLFKTDDYGQSWRRLSTDERQHYRRGQQSGRMPHQQSGGNGSVFRAM